MQLSYRGISYTPEQPTLPTAESDDYATFLGQRYRVRQVTAMPRHAQTTTLTYRGAHYCI